MGGVAERFPTTYKNNTFDNICNRLFFSIVTHFIIAYHISLVKVQTSCYNNNQFILDVKQLNKIMKLYYFHTFKALRDGWGKIKMYCGCPGLKSSYQEKGLFM